MADVETLKQALDADAQIVQTVSQIGQSIGDAKAVASATQRLSAVANTVSDEVTAIQTGLPTNPVQALSSVKQSLFEAAGTVSSTTTQLSGRALARTAAAQGEKLAALAIGLMRSQALPALSSRGEQLASAVSDTQQLQGDLAVNSTSRLTIYQDVGALHQLVSAWVAQRSIQAAVSHPSGTGGVTGATDAASASQSVAPANTQPQNLAGQVDQLIALHNDRVEAQTLLSAYPALQQTVASANLASQFVSDADAVLRQSLLNIGLSDPASLSAAKAALQAFDTTNWLDSNKAAVAEQATSRTTSALLANGKPPLASANDGAAIDQVKMAMAGWLDADKQNRYWAVQASRAQQSISTLDVALGSLSDRAGVDVTGMAAAAREKVSITKLSLDPSAVQWRLLLTHAANDYSAQSVLSYSGTR